MSYIIIALVSQACCDKLPPTGGLTTKEIYSPTVLEAQIRNEDVGRFASFSRLRGRNLTVFSSRWAHHSHLCLCTQMSVSLLLQRQQSLYLEPTLIQCDLNYIFRDPHFQIKSHSEVLSGHAFLHYSAHDNY